MRRSWHAFSVEFVGVIVFLLKFPQDGNAINAAKEQDSIFKQIFKDSQVSNEENSFEAMWNAGFNNKPYVTKPPSAKPKPPPEPVSDLKQWSQESSEDSWERAFKSEYRSTGTGASAGVFDIVNTTSTDPHSSDKTPESLMDRIFGSFKIPTTNSGEQGVTLAPLILGKTTKSALNTNSIKQQIKEKLMQAKLRKAQENSLAQNNTQFTTTTNQKSFTRNDMFRSMFAKQPNVVIPPPPPPTLQIPQPPPPTPTPQVPPPPPPTPQIPPPPPPTPQTPTPPPPTPTPINPNTAAIDPSKSPNNDAETTPKPKSTEELLLELKKALLALDERIKGEKTTTTADSSTAASVKITNDTKDNKQSNDEVLKEMNDAMKSLGSLGGMLPGFDGTTSTPKPSKTTKVPVKHEKGSDNPLKSLDMLKELEDSMKELESMAEADESATAPETNQTIVIKIQRTTKVPTKLKKGSSSGSKSPDDMLKELEESMKALDETMAESEETTITPQTTIIIRRTTKVPTKLNKHSDDTTKSPDELLDELDEAMKLLDGAMESDDTDMSTQRTEEDKNKVTTKKPQQNKQTEKPSGSKKSEKTNTWGNPDINFSGDPPNLPKMTEYKVPKLPKEKKKDIFSEGWDDAAWDEIEKMMDEPQPQLIEHVPEEARGPLIVDPNDEFVIDDRNLMEGSVAIVYEY